MEILSSDVYHRLPWSGKQIEGKSADLTHFTENCEITWPGTTRIELKLRLAHLPQRENPLPPQGRGELLEGTSNPMELVGGGPRSQEYLWSAIS
ncbi:MAG: hypothetical protein ABSC21_13105 [Terriglobia bacterium]